VTSIEAYFTNISHIVLCKLPEDLIDRIQAQTGVK
jgi:hypothetical protein